MSNPFGLNPILDDPEINVTYDQILAMNDTEFLDYVQRMRSRLRDIWDIQHLAPVRGWTEDEVRDDFNDMSSFNGGKFWHKDELTGRRVIINTHNVGNSVNSWNMDKMLRVRFNYSEKDDGRSIYQFFADDKLFKRYLPYARRHFLRDSFYFFAQTVQMGDALPHFPDIRPCAAMLYVKRFADHERPYGTHEILIEAKKKTKGYTGYASHLHEAEFFALTYAELKLACKLGDLTAANCRVIRAKELNDEYLFHVRVYEKGQHMFPAMFKSFRISMSSYAHQYPPLTAKLLYETYLRNVPGDEPLYIWDPSAGWGGRLLAALSLDLRTSHNEFRSVHYIGTDPNPDFYANGNVYDDIAAFYNGVRSAASLFDETNKANVLPYGSETFHRDAMFRSLRGRFDMVFSSPPYFRREQYSDDENQSCVKFSAYDDWRDGFLAQTLENAWNALAPGRILAWNIADIKVGAHKYLPLEQDTVDICKKLGFKQIEVIHMGMKSMPGANRIKEDGTLTAKNMSKVDGHMIKHEPIFIFQKP
jgi:hypothetical protein